MKIFFTLNLTLSFAGTPWQSCDKRYTCRAIIPGLSCAWITRLHSKNKIYRRLPENVERRAWTCDFFSNSLINGWKCAQVQLFFFFFFFFFQFNSHSFHSKTASYLPLIYRVTMPRRLLKEYPKNIYYGCFDTSVLPGYSRDSQSSVIE